MKALYGIVLLLLCQPLYLWAQQDSTARENLKFSLNASGSRYLQLAFLNQAWLRFAEYNPGTTVQGEERSEGFDIGLRRTRFQLLGQLTERAFVYFQFGMNNFNREFGIGANRKNAAFLHDALCEYRLSPKNELKIGAGLTIANGLSRFSQPSIGTIATMDVPVFAQTTVDQTDLFSRKLSVYARGQLGNIDYRFSLSDPFPISSNGSPTPSLSTSANFTPYGHRLQTQGYVMYQFLEHEPHTTPYMTGTFLGKKKIFNIGLGAIHQAKATWNLSSSGDTSFHPLFLWAVESFVDLPLPRKQAISAYLGYFHQDYGPDYLRYNGLMNPANGFKNGQNALSGAGPAWGTAFPMFGTGWTIYSQIAYLFPSDLWPAHWGRLQAYASWQHSQWQRLQGLSTDLVHVGVNWLAWEHRIKWSLDWEWRPTYALNGSNIERGSYRKMVVLQFQLSF